MLWWGTLSLFLLLLPAKAISWCSEYQEYLFLLQLFKSPWSQKDPLPECCFYSSLLYKVIIQMITAGNFSSETGFVVVLSVVMTWLFCKVMYRRSWASTWLWTCSWSQWPDIEPYQAIQVSDHRIPWIPWMVDRLVYLLQFLVFIQNFVLPLFDFENVKGCPWIRLTWFWPYQTLSLTSHLFVLAYNDLKDVPQIFFLEFWVVSLGPLFMSPTSP